MKPLAIAFLLVQPLLAADSPFAGRWDFNTKTTSAVGANWLGVQATWASLDIWFQPTGGNVYQVRDYKLEGNTLTLNLRGMTWTVEPKDGTLIGVQKKGEDTTILKGMRAPELKRAMPKAWTKPEPLFDGRTLAGWEPIGDPKNSHWMVKDGLLINQDHGANLKTVRKFDDFKVHFEVNCPDLANSGFYLRGRYEIQLEYEPVGSEPPERRMGAIYGRIPSKVEPARKPGEWETFDVTLVGRMLTVQRDGVTTIDNKEIEGITGGALDANEGEPGPFYIQGDHTGGLKFRNITVAVPR